MKKTLVIGASENTDRYSNKAIKALVSKGHEVVAIGLHAGEVAGVTFDSESYTLKISIPLHCMLARKIRPDIIPTSSG